MCFPSYVAPSVAATGERIGVESCRFRGGLQYVGLAAMAAMAAMAPMQSLQLEPLPRKPALWLLWIRAQPQLVCHLYSLRKKSRSTATALHLRACHCAFPRIMTRTLQFLLLARSCAAAGPSGHLPDGSPDGVEHLPDGSPDGMEQFQRSGARRYQSHRNPMPTVPRSWEAMNIHTLARAEPEQAAEPGQPDLRAASAPPILPNAPPKILCRVCRKAALGIRMRTCRFCKDCSSAS